jgi:histone H3/H4
MPKVQRKTDSRTNSKIAKTPLPLAATSDDTTTPRKKPRFHPGVQAAREIKRLEKSTKKIIPFDPFKRCVREVLQGIGDGSFIIRRDGVQAIQEEAEKAITELLRKAYVVTRVCGRIKILPKDMTALVQINDDEVHHKGIMGAYRKYLELNKRVSKDDAKMDYLMKHVSNGSGSAKKRLRKGGNLETKKSAAKTPTKKEKKTPVLKTPKAPKAPKTPKKPTTDMVIDEPSIPKKKQASQTVATAVSTPVVQEENEPQPPTQQTVKATQPITKRLTREEHIRDLADMEPRHKRSANEAARRKAEEIALLEPYGRKHRKDSEGLKVNNEFPDINPYEILKNPGSINEVLEFLDYKKGNQRFTDKKGNIVTVNYTS